MKKLYGVGINNADYAVTQSEVSNGKHKMVWVCPYYKVWTNMMKRCYCPKYQEAMPTYKIASVHPEWFSFMNFRGWMQTQVWEGLELDKDILSSGGKLYSKGTCCFVPRRVNSVLLINPETRGPFPIGAALTKTGKYQSLCKDASAKAKALGTYQTPMQAHAAWQVFKSKVIVDVANIYKEEVYGRQDVYEQLIAVADKLIDESKKGKETVSMWI